MRKILITGADSYIGTSFENWLKKCQEDYAVDTVDMIEGSWRNKDFSKYEAVFHVAGIAHVSSKQKLKNLYYKVNRDLAIETAQKAKAEGVHQFIFMSSIIVYGDNIDQNGAISCDTVPKPCDFYGESKLQAENAIKLLESEKFKVVILRPPMIYGKNSKGNFRRLAKAAQTLPIFPKINNQRSMLYIENLCEFIRLMIDNEERGIFFPQNSEHVNTSELVYLIRKAYGKKTIMLSLNRFFTYVFYIAQKNFKVIHKLFGNLTYEFPMSKYKQNYAIKKLEESIKSTVNN